MGFDTEKFHQWLITQGWLTPDVTYDDFVKAINGVTISALIKAHDQFTTVKRQLNCKYSHTNFEQEFYCSKCGFSKVAWRERTYE